MTTTLIPADPQADALRSALSNAQDHGEQALQHVADRIRLMASAGAILSAKKEQGELDGWLDLHFADDAPDTDMQKRCIALHRELPKLDLDKRGDVIKAETLACLLPGFDGAQGVSKRPISYLTPLYRLHQVLKGMTVNGVDSLTTAERARIKEEMQPLVEIWGSL